MFRGTTFISNRSLFYRDREKRERPFIFRRTIYQLDCFLFHVTYRESGSRNQYMNVTRVVLGSSHETITILFQTNAYISRLSMMGISTPRLPILLRVFASVFYCMRDPLLFLNDKLHSVCNNVRFGKIYCRLPNSGIRYQACQYVAA